MPQNSIILDSVSPSELFLKIREIIKEELASHNKPEVPQVYHTKKEVAIKLRISLPTVDRLTADGKLKAVRVGRRVLYRSDDIEACLSQIEALRYRKS